MKFQEQESARDIIRLKHYIDKFIDMMQHKRHCKYKNNIIIYKNENQLVSCFS